MLLVFLADVIQVLGFCSPGELVQPPQSEGVQRAPTPPAEPPPKPSKRLTILTECVWANEGDRSRVLKVLCERMASNQLNRRFWIKKYLIIPMAQHVEGSGTDRCVHYRIRITTPKTVKPAAPMASRPPSPPSPQVGSNLITPAALSHTADIHQVSAHSTLSAAKRKKACDYRGRML